jgi:nucleotide-binding universal stress UspA family protein
VSTESLHPGIIVGVDGSPQSAAALRWAVAEAVMHDEELTIVHVSPLIGGWSGVGLSGSPLAEETVEWQQQGAQRLIEDALQTARDCAGAASLRISTEMPSASVVPTLIDLTKQARMIVVGSSGQGALSRALLGSVSTALIHHSHCPVAVLHAEVSPEQRDGPIVVGVDLSPASEAATALAFEEASARHAELVALHACSDDEWVEHAPIPWSAISANLEETLAQSLAGWQERYPDVVVRRKIVRVDPARHLLEESESAQLVVLGSHGRGGFAGMLLGSVSSAVVHGITTPVMVARLD